MCVVSVAGLPACQQRREEAPPPDARRPVLKTEAELAAGRAEAIHAGRVVPTSAPVILGADRVTQPRRRPPAPVQPTPGAIEADILIVNDSVLAVAEVLYPLREQIAELHDTHTPAGFREQVQRLVRRTAQREIGAILVYSEAIEQLEEPQRERLDAVIDNELENLTARRFGGSTARLRAHLAESGLTVEQFRGTLARQIVVQNYTREKLMPKVHVRRDELLTHYRRNKARYSTPETRELRMIELPFDAFLPEGQTWAQAGRLGQAQAKLKAMQQARDAHDALQSKSFAEVAQEFSRGPHAERGGSWGMIGRPLQAPHDVSSGLVFEFEEGQYSEAVETSKGWYIVQCGRIEPAVEQSFVDVQDEIRRDVMESRFAKLSVDYVVRLAEKATISSLNAFVASAVERVEQQCKVDASSPRAGR